MKHILNRKVNEWNDNLIKKNQPTGTSEEPPQQKWSESRDRNKVWGKRWPWFGYAYHQNHYVKNIYNWEHGWNYWRKKNPFKNIPQKLGTTNTYMTIKFLNQCDVEIHIVSIHKKYENHIMSLRIWTRYMQGNLFWILLNQTKFEL